MASSIDASIPRLQPIEKIDGDESESIKTLVKNLGLMKHIEGGYFAEIDRNPLIIPNPFLSPSSSTQQKEGDWGEKRDGMTASAPRGGDDKVRNASTSIFYLLSRTTPLGSFHRNRGRTVNSPKLSPPSFSSRPLMAISFAVPSSPAIRVI